MDLSNFVPPVYKDDINNVLTKCISLFEDLLSGRVSSNHNIDDNIETLGKYWDVVRTKSKTKVKEMLDPYGISDIIVSDDITLTKFLYLLPTLYSSKGTYKMFKFILKLCGMDAEIIRWYEDDYLKYQTTRQECAAILILKVGKTALTDETVSKFNKLIDLLLDVCLVISSMILVKNLDDQVELLDTSIFQFASDVTYDNYSVCEFILNDRYRYKKYIPSSLDFDKTEELRFLSPSQLIRYECSNCGYLYDPVIGYENNIRVPFSELPKNWVCPICSSTKQFFVTIETNPIPGLQTLKLALLLIKYSNDYNLFIDYINSSNLVVSEELQIIYDAIQYFITNKNCFTNINVSDLHKQIASDLLYLIKAIEEDSYGFLTELDIPVSAAVLSKYYHGMELSPYILHANPKTAFKFLTHKFDEVCTNLHNSRVFYTYVNTHVTEWKEDYFDIRIKHPVMYYDSNIPANHNFEFHRNQYFDLNIRPKRICSDANYVSMEGTYAYPRYMGNLETHVKETIAYSLINGFYDKTLSVVFKNLQKQFPLDFLVLVKQILSMFSNSNKTLLPKFCESIPYLISYDLTTLNMQPFTNLFKKVGSDFCYNKEISSDLTSIKDLSPEIPLNASKIKAKFYEICKDSSFIDGMLILDKIASNLRNVNKTKQTKQLIPYVWRTCSTELFFEIDTSFFTDTTFNFVLERGTFYYDGEMNHDNRDSAYDTLKLKTSSYVVDDASIFDTEINYVVTNLLNDDAEISYIRNGKLFYNSLYIHNPDSKLGFNLDYLDNMEATKEVETSLEVINEFSTYQNYADKQICGDHEYYVEDKLNTIRNGDFTYNDFKDHSLQNNYSLLGYTFLHDSNVHRTSFLENERCINGKHIKRSKDGTYLVEKLKTVSFSVDEIDPLNEELISKIISNVNIDIFTSKNRDNTYFYDGIKDHSEITVNGISTEVALSNINNNLSDLYSTLFSEYSTHNFEINHDSLYFSHNNEDRNFKYNEFKSVNLTYAENPVIENYSVKTNEIYNDTIDEPIVFSNDTVKDSLALDTIDITSYRNSSYYYNSLYNHNDFKEQTFINLNNNIVDSLEVKSENEYLPHNIKGGKSKVTYDGSITKREGFRTVYSRVYFNGEPVQRVEDHGFEILKLNIINEPFDDNCKLLELSYDIEIIDCNSLLQDSYNLVYERNGTFFHNGCNSYNTAKRDFVSKFIEKLVIEDSLDFRDTYISHDFFNKTQCKYLHNGIERNFNYTYQSRVWINGLPLVREKVFEYEFIKNFNTLDVTDIYPFSEIEDVISKQSTSILYENMELNVRGRNITYNSFNKHDIEFEYKSINCNSLLDDSFEFSTPSIYQYDSIITLSNKHDNCNFHNGEISYENNNLRIFSCKRGKETSYELLSENSNFSLYDEVQNIEDNLYSAKKEILYDEIDFNPRNGKLNYSGDIIHKDINSLPDNIFDSNSHNLSDIFFQKEDSINNYKHNGFLNYSDIDFYSSKCYMKKDHEDIYRGNSFLNSGCIYNGKYQHKTTYNYDGTLDYSNSVINFSDSQKQFRLNGTEQLSVYMQEEVDYNFKSNHTGKSSHSGFRRFNTYEDSERRNL